MILVDTSVWISFFRGDAAVKTRLASLLDRDAVAMASPIKLEILAGARKTDVQVLQRLLAALPTFYPVDSTWQRCEEWIREGLSKGQSFGAFDLLIASIGVDVDASVWSLDKDFKRMASLGWIELG